ncbi:MAG: hypothetical protein K0U98_23290 [Deltaproteobacteria bacterium]|nr:hypothetical protein [Deltaproteobacteria bacterium]
MSHLADDEEILRQLARAARQRRGKGSLRDSDLDSRTEEILASHDAEAFGTAFRGSVVDAIREGLAKGEESAPSEGPAIGFPRGERPRALAQRWQPMILVAASLVMVVTISLWFGFSIGPRARAEPVPIYTEDPPEGVSPERSEGDPQARIEVVPGFRFRVVLRPESTPEGSIDVRIFAAMEPGSFGELGSLERWLAAEAKAEVNESGVIRLEGLEAQDWRPLTPGEWTLHYAIGRPDSLPSLAEVRELLDRGEVTHRAAGEAVSWQLLSQDIHLVSSP